jgi:tripartite-type tricarboxylate transporter receptor subunit TctC
MNKRVPPPAARVRFFLLFAALLTCAAGNACAAAATAYPVKALRIIVPFAPGGPNDLLARLVGQRLAEAWGQQVIIDNRPGGSTMIGTELAAKAAPDGYTLLMVSTSHAVNPSLQPKLPYDTQRDFAPVIQLVSSPNVLVTNPSLPVKSVRELVALARARPGEINYGSGGTGTATHLGGALLCLLANVKMTHVPYKGDAPASIDLISGQISWMFGTILPIMPHIKSGKMRAIAVSSTARTPSLPDVPAVAETLPQFEATSWYGVFAPAATAQEVVARLNAEMSRIVRAPEMRERLAREGTEAVGGTPEEFAAFFRASSTKWARVIREANIKLD